MWQCGCGTQNLDTRVGCRWCGKARKAGQTPDDGLNGPYTVDVGGPVTITLPPLAPLATLTLGGAELRPYLIGLIVQATEPWRARGVQCKVFSFEVYAPGDLLVEWDGPSLSGYKHHVTGGQIAQNAARLEQLAQLIVGNVVRGMGLVP